MSKIYETSETKDLARFDVYIKQKEYWYNDETGQRVVIPYVDEKCTKLLTSDMVLGNLGRIIIVIPYEDDDVCRMFAVTDIGYAQDHNYVTILLNEDGLKQVMVRANLYNAVAEEDVVVGSKELIEHLNLSRYVYTYNPDAPVPM